MVQKLKVRQRNVRAEQLPDISTSPVTPMAWARTTAQRRYDTQHEPVGAADYAA